MADEVELSGVYYSGENMGTGFGHNARTVSGADGQARRRWVNMWVDGLAQIAALVASALGYRDAAAGSATTASNAATTATTQAGVATTQAGIATTQAGIATTKAAEAADSAAAASASAASIADGPVASVNGETGVVTLTAAGIGATTENDAFFFASM